MMDIDFMCVLFITSANTIAEREGKKMEKGMMGYDKRSGDQVTVISWPLTYIGKSTDNI